MLTTTVSQYRGQAIIFLLQYPHNHEYMHVHFNCIATVSLMYLASETFKVPQYQV